MTSASPAAPCGVDWGGPAAAWGEACSVTGQIPDFAVAWYLVRCAAWSIVRAAPGGVALIGGSCRGAACEPLHKFFACSLIPARTGNVAGRPSGRTTGLPLQVSHLHPNGRPRYPCTQVRHQARRMGHV